MALVRTALFLAAFALTALAPGVAHGQSTLRPLVYIETDPNGAPYVRVMERRSNPITPSRTIQNLTSSPRIIISDSQSTLVRNVTVRNARYGVSVSGTGQVSIDTFSYIDWNGEGSIYGGAIKLARPSSAAAYVQRVFADGMEAPDPTYDRSNTDFIGVERNSNPVFVRYATGRNFGDAGVDAKSNVALMSVTINGAHRGLRIWSGVQLTIADSIINVPEGHEQVWFEDATSRLRYHNVLWCVGATTPSPNSSDCSTSPTIIGADKITVTQARAQITALSSNPLPAANSFFATQIDRIVIEYSSNAGATWRAMASGGASGRAPLGDTRYRIPFSLASGTYLFRAYFERNGARVGATAVVNEAGQAVGL
jgi:hypothetical protein